MQKIITRKKLFFYTWLLIIFIEFIKKLNKILSLFDFNLSLIYN